MKRISILFLTLSLVLCSACNNDDNANMEDPLAGTWDLSTVYGGLILVNIEYNEGDVIWTFNRSNGQLVVQNNILTTGPEQIYSGLPTGTYNYDVSIEDNQEILYVDNERKGALIFETSSFQIDNGLASDGLLTTFSR